MTDTKDLKLTIRGRMMDSCPTKVRKKKHKLIKGSRRLGGFKPGYGKLS